MFAKISLSLEVYSKRLVCKSAEIFIAEIHLLTKFSHEYAGTWIAANLRIQLPTPQSHPSFELWALGYQPTELWDIFWPDGFQYPRS